MLPDAHDLVQQATRPVDVHTCVGFLGQSCAILIWWRPSHLQLIGLPHGSSSVYCLLRRVSLCLRIDASWSRCFQCFEGNSTGRPKSNWCPTRWLRFSRHVMQFTCSIAPLIRLSKRTRLLHDVFLHLHLCYPVSCPKHRF